MASQVASIRTHFPHSERKRMMGDEKQGGDHSGKPDTSAEDGHRDKLPQDVSKPHDPNKK